jgi:cellulose synthase/poly-beta-1,6-N-acetylglucosamine synthase-like glycosyltransferase
MKKLKWSASITEDIDQHMALIMGGERVSFAPDAVVWGEMPSTLTNSESQISRWESGRLQMARQHVTPLLKSAWKEGRRGNTARSFILFDAAVEHLIPPFSILFGLSIGLVLLDLLGIFLSNLLAGSSQAWLFSANGGLFAINLLLGMGLVSGQMIYLLSGLKMVQAPSYIYRSLLHAPGFVIWKIGNYIRVLFGRGQKGWVRTPRNGETS